MSIAAYQISIAGTNVTSNFDPVLIELEICDSDGGKADSCTILLDDAGGMIALPEPGSPVEVLLWWIEPPPGAAGGAVQFTGVVDEPQSAMDEPDLLDRLRQKEQERRK